MHFVTVNACLCIIHYIDSFYSGQCAACDKKLAFISSAKVLSCSITENGTCVMWHGDEIPWGYFSNFRNCGGKRLRWWRRHAHCIWEPLCCQCRHAKQAKNEIVADYNMLSALVFNMRTHLTSGQDLSKCYYKVFFFLEVLQTISCQSKSYFTLIAIYWLFW